MSNKYTDTGYPQYDGYMTPRSLKRFEDISEDHYRVFQRTIKGRITKARYKLIDRMRRVYSRSPRYRCGHDYDCCGCLCSQNMSFEMVGKNEILIMFKRGYNY